MLQRGMSLASVSPGGPVGKQNSTESHLPAKSSASFFATAVSFRDRIASILPTPFKTVAFGAVPEVVEIDAASGDEEDSSFASQDLNSPATRQESEKAKKIKNRRKTGAVQQNNRRDSNASQLSRNSSKLSKEIAGENDNSDEDATLDASELAMKEERKARKRASLQACAKQASVAYSIFTVDDSIDTRVIRFNSGFNRQLTVILTISVLWTAGYTPFFIAFSDRMEKLWSRDGKEAVDTMENDESVENLLPVAIFNLLVDLLYAYGVFLRLFTSVCDLTFGKEWCKLKTIRFHVFRMRTFWLDSLSLLPLLLQPLPPFTNLFFGDWNSVSKTFEAFKLLRLWRLILIPSSHLEAEYSISVHIGRVVTWVFLLGHVLGCFWFLILESNSTTDLHVDISDDIMVKQQTLHSWYLFGLREGVYILTGRVRPAFSDQEMTLLSLMSPTGSFFFAIVSANCTVLLSRLDAVKRKHHEQMCFVRSAMTSLNLPDDLRSRIEKYHLFLAIHHNLNAYNSLFQGLSVQLFTELKATIYDKLFRNAPFFRNAPEEFIHSIVLALEETTFSPGENVIIQGEIGAEMYWILRGRCDVIDSSGIRVVATLCENNFFGEVALLVQTPRLCSVRAATYSLLAQITRDKFLPIIDEFPQQKQYFIERIRSYQLEQSKDNDQQPQSDDPFLEPEGREVEPHVNATPAVVSVASEQQHNYNGMTSSTTSGATKHHVSSPSSTSGQQQGKKQALLLLDTVDKSVSDFQKQKFRKTGVAPAITISKEKSFGAAEQGEEEDESGDREDKVNEITKVYSTISPLAQHLPPAAQQHNKVRSSFAQPGREKILGRRTSFAQGFGRPGEDSIELGDGASSIHTGHLAGGGKGLMRRNTRQSIGEQSEGGTRIYTALDQELESEVARLHREMERQTAQKFKLAVTNPIQEKIHQLRVEHENDSSKRRLSALPTTGGGGASSSSAHDSGTTTNRVVGRLTTAVSKVVLGNKLRQSFAAPSPDSASVGMFDDKGHAELKDFSAQHQAQKKKELGRRASQVSNHHVVSLNAMLANPCGSLNICNPKSTGSGSGGGGGLAVSSVLSEQRMLKQQILEPLKEELHVIRELVEDVLVQQETIEMQIRVLDSNQTQLQMTHNQSMKKLESVGGGGGGQGQQQLAMAPSRSTRDGDQLEHLQSLGALDSSAVGDSGGHVPFGGPLLESD
ncbi:unnamed protein product [Amoebophrya sp. A120]|nr:unnamed protein product [Amoebophrya sp. A120]|eukprot:GSA120T00022000001.1